MSKISRKAEKLRKQSWEDRANKKNDKIFGFINIVLLLAIVIVIMLIVFSCHSQDDVQPSETATTEEIAEETSSTDETEESSAEESELEATETSESVSETAAVSENSELEEGTTEQSSSASSVKPQSEPSSVVVPTKKAKVTVKIKSITSVYGDEFKALDFDVEGSVKKAELSKYIALAKQEGSNAGQYWITGVCTAPSLFDVTFVPGIYTITLRDVTIQVENKESLVGEKLKPLTYTTISGSIVNGDKVVELSTKAEPAKVGTYDIVGTNINPNYNLTVKSGKYTVKAKGSSDSDTKPINVTVNISDKSSYYGDKIAGLDFSVTKGDVKKDELKKYIRLEKAAGNNVGNYAITGKCTDTGKYNVSFKNGTYTVKPRKLSVSIDNKESFVGDKLATLTYSVKSGSVVAGDKCIELSTNADPAKVGTYDIVGKCTNSNYDATIEKGVYTVKEKPAKDVTIQIESKTSTYGDSIVGFDFSIVNGDVTKAEIAPYITLTKEGNNNVGEHKISGSCSEAKKYNVTFIEGTYTITQRSISLKVDDKQTYEGENLSDLTYKLTSGSIIAGDDVISLLTDANPSAIGEYPIVVECKNSNYVLHSENGTYRVKARPQPPKDEEEEVEGDTSSSSPSETEEGPKDEEEEVKPSQPTPSSPVDGPSDDEEDIEPNKPTPSEPSDGPTEESEEVRPGTSTP